MVDFTNIEWTMAIIALLAAGGLVVWFTRLIPKGRLMRCPETGSIAFVEVNPASPVDEEWHKLTVCKCELWPETKNCGRGCLARYSETTLGFPIDVRPLRPFEPK
jgi:hypothetical protein